MRCAEFESRLDVYVAGELGDDEQRLADAHVSSCASCSNLLAVVRGERDVTLQPASEGVVAPLLQRTIGSACGRAQEQFGDWLDEGLSGQDRQLLELHTEHCTSCNALARALVALRRDVAEMVEVAPDVDFVADVLERTRELPRKSTVSLRERLRGIWEQISQRPRFAWEVAYVATVILVVLFGTPASPWRGMPKQALAVIQLSPSTTFAATKTRATQVWHVIEDDVQQVWQVTGGPIADRARSAAAAYAAENRDVVDAWLNLRGRSARLNAAVSRGDLGQASLVLDEMSADVQALFRGLRNRSVPPDSTDAQRARPTREAQSQ